MKDREKFECWLCNDYFDGMDGPGDFIESRGIYKDYQVHLAWRAFNAGRESMRQEIIPLVYGMCESDNVAARTVEAIRKIDA